jgi:DNA mismatch repair protein MutS2
MDKAGWHGMQERVLHILEYDKVRQHVRGFAATRLGQERLEQMRPLSSIAEAEAELAAVDEALRMLLRRGGIPFGGIRDIRPHLRKAAIGGVLTAGDLNEVAFFIAGGRRARTAIEAAAEAMDIPRLQEMAAGLFDARQTELELRQAIDEDGLVLDQASPELRRIRNQRRAEEARIRERLDQMVRHLQRWLQDPVVTVRGDSFCLPVRVEFKNQVPGVVHDVSSSGATVFIEPQEIVQMSARVRALAAEEDREIERVLQRLSGVVAAVAEPLAENAERLATLDAWMAKAEYARREDAQRPRLRTDGVWRLTGARHPLIPKEAAVPIDIRLGDDFRMVIITGPNTGGKTVTLKTVGLLTLLAMSGCFLTTRSPSDIGWCGEVFADIGDEQSIEQSLSTFSSHMRNIIGMLEHVGPDSLVLLDELGAGTDPAEGAALSMAILDWLKARGARVVATTHYAELKAYAFREPAAINASVEFDVDTLRPTYRLLLGVPGRSNALAIAARLGMPETLIDQARHHLRTDDVRVEDLIAQLEAARREAERLRAEAEQELAEARRERAQWVQEREAFEQSVEQAREAALREAREVVARARTEAERVIRELRDRQRGGPVKDHELVELRKALEDALPEERRVARRKGGDAGRAAVGSTVRVLSVGQKGEVVERSADGRELTVQLGMLRMKVPVDDVEVLSAAPERVQAVRTVKRSVQTVPLQLDIRGLTVEEALPSVDRYLDQAVLSGLPRVTIIHGKGTGALRDGVRRYLSKHPHVSSWAPGGPGEGGDGATVVELK